MRNWGCRLEVSRRAKPCENSWRAQILGRVRKYFDCAILNPPYKKINSDSRTRSLLREIGVETSNVYTGFLAIVLKLLAPGGEIVAITPRSFCNGPYFKPFRKLLLETVHLTRVHVFESRTVAFSEDDVLQENVIFHGVKGAESKRVVISSSNGPDDEHITHREVPYSELLRPGDPEYFIHIVADEVGKQIAGRMARLSTRLEDLKVTVSTGRVVDFRASKFLRRNPDKETVPLIYPGHFSEGFVRWPREKTKKPNALAVGPGAVAQLSERVSAPAVRGPRGT